MAKDTPPQVTVFKPGTNGSGASAPTTPPVEVLGVKAHRMAQVAQLGLAQPAWAAISTGDVQAMQAAAAKTVAQLEEATGAKMGGVPPLLLTLRHSAPFNGIARFGPVFNIGLGGVKAVEAWIKQGGDERAAWDALRRLVESYAVHVAGHPREDYEQPFGQALEDAGAEAEHELEPKAMRAAVETMLATYSERAGTEFPQDPAKQLDAAVQAAQAAWETPTAQDRLVENGYSLNTRPAVILQATSQGTWGNGNGSGSIATRNPATGENAPRVRYLETALGPDLVAGHRIPTGLEGLEKSRPEAAKALMEAASALENHFKDALEIQFAICDGIPHILSTAPLRRSAKASLKIALDLVQEGAISEREGLRLLNPAVIDEYMHPVLDKSSGPQPLCKGLPASPGSAVGQVVFFAEHAVELAAQGIKTILVRHETTPEDIDGLKVAEGIITGHGGLTSHAAVVARGMGKCCIVGASALKINYLINEMTVGKESVQRLDWVSMDGNTGEIFVGQLPQMQPSLEGGIATVLGWADQHRRLGVFANADTAEDAARAVELGAGGIGLCRTEHMFFDMNRIPLFRKMILAMDEVGRSAALSELLPLQRKDFMDIFRVMEGRPVTIRLLDPPLNEFLPKGPRSQSRMARAMGISVETIQQRTEALTENNPMMGHRGCRLAVTYPEIYNMQVRAIVEAACIVKKEGVEVHPEIMVPLVSTPRELRHLREEINVLVQQVMGELGESLPIKVGTMVETPRAALASAAIARHADFYSFGTNDLTQMSFGFSRDDVGIFLPMYLEKGLLDVDPFVELDQQGTGRLVRMAVEEGRQINPDLRLGICGEHGGDPRSVKFFHRVGLDYVSCSPFRLPVARLAAGQAAVED